jgi:hypothetical protein
VQAGPKVLTPEQQKAADDANRKALFSTSRAVAPNLKCRAIVRNWLDRGVQDKSKITPIEIQEILKRGVTKEELNDCLTFYMTSAAREKIGLAPVDRMAQVDAALPEAKGNPFEDAERNPFLQENPINVPLPGDAERAAQQGEVIDLKPKQQAKYYDERGALLLTPRAVAPNLKCRAIVRNWLDRGVQDKTKITPIEIAEILKRGVTRQELDSCLTFFMKSNREKIDIDSVRASARAAAAEELRPKLEAAKKKEAEGPGRFAVERELLPLPAAPPPPPPPRELTLVEQLQRQQAIDEAARPPPPHLPRAPPPPPPPPPPPLPPAAPAAAPGALVPASAAPSKKSRWSTARNKYIKGPLSSTLTPEQQALQDAQKLPPSQLAALRQFKSRPGTRRVRRAVAASPTGTDGERTPPANAPPVLPAAAPALSAAEGILAANQRTAAAKERLAVAKQKIAAAAPAVVPAAAVAAPINNMDNERILAKQGLDKAVERVTKVKNIIKTTQASLAAAKPNEKLKKNALTAKMTRLTNDLVELQAAAQRAQVSFDRLQLVPANYVRGQEDNPAGRAAASAVAAAFEKPPQQAGRRRKTRRRRRRTYREPKGLFAF